MNPISDTAYYSCGVRMIDARRRRPWCNDIYAERFMDQRGREILERFNAERDPNMTNVARHRFIDDAIRHRLKSDPSLRIVLIGCGFDSRAFRLRGGEWIELDEPTIIERKNRLLAAKEAPNPVVRIPIEFATEPLHTKLGRYADPRPTIVVLEGVTMYVPSVALERTLNELRQLFSSHEIIADLMTRDFAEKHGKRIKELIADIGVNFDPVSNPSKSFERVGYQETSSESIVCRVLKYQHLGWLCPWLNLTSPDLVEGYTIRTFV